MHFFNVVIHAFAKNEWRKLLQEMHYCKNVKYVKPDVEGAAAAYLIRHWSHGWFYQSSGKFEYL